METTQEDTPYERPEDTPHEHQEETTPDEHQEETSPDERQEETPPEHAGERRRAERVRTSIYVDWGTTGECLLSGRIINLSALGCYLHTRDTVGHGETIFIRFWLPTERVLRGEIRYCLEKVGVGVQFMELTDEEQEAMSRLVEDCRANPPSERRSREPGVATA